MPSVFRVDPHHPDPALIAQAAEKIRAGLVVAYPTDTLYGLAVDPRNGDAVRRLFALKGRPESSALTLIAADVEQARDVAEMSTNAARLVKGFWPGPLTIVMAATAVVAPETLAGGRTVGVRVPDHAVARALARAAGFCITATSANRSGEPPAASAEDVAGSLPDVDAIVDGGASRGGSPSTIVDASLTELALIRDGAVPWDRVIKFR
jgi:L-threonylcarbamoyladenylate synthase